MDHHKEAILLQSPRQWALQFSAMTCETRCLELEYKVEVSSVCQSQFNPKSTSGGPRLVLMQLFDLIPDTSLSQYSLQGGSSSADIFNISHKSPVMLRVWMTWRKVFCSTHPASQVRPWGLNSSQKPSSSLSYINPFYFATQPRSVWPGVANITDLTSDTKSSSSISYSSSSIQLISSRDLFVKL